MDILEGIKTRMSVRGFKRRPIAKAVMKKILEAAGNSPSYTNTQPWEVAVVSGAKKEELARKLLKLAKTQAPMSPDMPPAKAWPQALEERSRLHGARRLATLGIARDDEQGRENLRLMNFEFYGAPCVVFLFIDGSLGPWSIFDVGLFTENLILAAHSFGVESCLQASVTNYAPEIKRFLKIDKSKKLVLGISLGYPDDKARLNAYRSLKLKPEEFTGWYE